VRVAVTGATGTTGRALVAALLERGDSVVALSRDAARARSALPSGVEAFSWPAPQDGLPPTEALEGVDGVVHLLGEPIAQRWSDSVRREIRDSRVLSTRNLVGALAELTSRPGVLVSQSASGYYGPRGDEVVDESGAAGDDFLAEVCVAWEAEARAAEELGMRVALTRAGVVLSPSGGALEKMLPFFKLGVGGPVAGGKQYVPWIHLDDIVGALIFCLDNPGASGPVNASAPDPVTNAELSKALGRVLHRPAFAPVPGAAVKLLYGDMASVVTEGVRMVPARLEELGYQFKRPELESSLKLLLRD
jgi:uncharacterized protein (TIGR01777 family)